MMTSIRIAYRTGAALVRPVVVLLAAAMTCAIGAARAQQSAGLQSYDVELVIFRPLQPNATPEQWQLEAAAAGQRLAIPDDDASPFDAPSAALVPVPASFPALPASRFRLTAIEETLRRSRNFQPLAHFGWTQPGYPRNAATYLPINSLVPSTSGLMGRVALSRGRAAAARGGGRNPGA